MKHLVALTIFIASITLNMNIHAQNNEILTENFDINLPPLTATVSNKMLADGRKAATKNATALFHQADDPVVGNPNGTITMVVFFDYQCPLSEKMDPIIQALIQANPDLRVVYKELALRGEKSVYAAKAALAAKLQGKYLPLHTALMQIGRGINKDKVIAIAESQGLDMQKLKADINNPAMAQKISQIYYLAKTIGVLGTPTLFFAKTNVSAKTNPDSILFMMGKFEQHDLQQAIDYVKSK